jgi:excisionase family DNA binding protein
MNMCQKGHKVKDFLSGGNMESSERFSYTLKEVARMTGISMSLVRRLISRGEIKTFTAAKDGRLLLVARQDLDAWRENNRLKGFNSK